MIQKILACSCIDKDRCNYKICCQCGSDNIIFRNYSHVCLSCNVLQDVTLLEPFIICKRHGKFNRDDQECPKCMRSW
jgi:hypothetical protein